MLFGNAYLLIFLIAVQCSLNMPYFISYLLRKLHFLEQIKPEVSLEIVSGWKLICLHINFIGILPYFVQRCHPALASIVLSFVQEEAELLSDDYQYLGITSLVQTSEENHFSKLSTTIDVD